MIDAHILLGTEPVEWRNEALADIAELPIHLHLYNAVVGGPAQARIKGWLSGNSQFITWFDPDDRYPQPAATEFINAAVDAMYLNPRLACCYSCEQRVDSELIHIGRVDDRPYSMAMMLTHPSWVHGLVVLRRTAMLDHVLSIDHAQPHPEWQLYKAMARSRLQFRRFPQVARLWRQHPNQAHRIRN